MPLWERRESESSQAYQAFCLYRDLGADRSIVSAYNLCREKYSGDESAQKASRAPGRWNKWSQQHAWLRRARAWDNEQDRLRRAVKAKELEEMIERHAQMARLFQRKVLERMSKIDASKLSAKDLVTWFKEAVLIERLCMGVVTEVKNLRLTDGDGEPLKQTIFVLPSNGREE